MSILIRKSGILTTVQDLGRFGYRSLGINPGGAMDRTAVRLINLLLGNRESAAVLELHFPAAEIVFESPCRFAIGGADLSPQLDDSKIDLWRSYNAKSGSILRFAEKKVGNRAYLAVSGGLNVKKWLGSSSTNLTACIGGLDGRRFLNGDRIDLVQSEPDLDSPEKWISPTLLPHYSVFPTVRVIAGAKFDQLQKESSKLFGSQNYLVSNNSNRMGFRLSGECLSLRSDAEYISSAVSFGTIQLLPDGQLIVLMADHQTVGGYPRIAHVIERDLPVLAQLGAGNMVAFHMISLAEAEALFAEQERNIALFRVACKAT